MTGFIPEKDRNVIPRWRPFYITQTLPELHSSKPLLLIPQETIASTHFARRISEWEKHRTIGHASDLVGTALIEEKLREVTDAIDFLLEDSTKAAPLAKNLAAHARNVLDGIEYVPSTPSTQQELRNQVSRLRKLLRKEPKNPIQWVDISRTYANLGQYKQSSHCMDIAMNLAPNNRFVLRSAARLWVHTDQEDKAYHILIRSDRTPHDPWLLAAEIAVGTVAKMRPRFVKAAKRMLASKNFLPSHLSELASSVATLEWKSGFRKNLQEIFQTVLERTY